MADLIWRIRCWFAWHLGRTDRSDHLGRFEEWSRYDYVLSNRDLAWFADRLRSCLASNDRRSAEALLHDLEMTAFEAQIHGVPHDLSCKIATDEGSCRGHQCVRSYCAPST